VATPYLGLHNLYATMRTLLLSGVFLYTLFTTTVSGQTKTERIAPDVYAEADLQRLAELLDLEEQQLGKYRAMLVQSEQNISEERQQLQQLQNQLESAHQKTYQQILTTLTEAQVEKLQRLLEEGELPLLWTTAPVGSTTAKGSVKAKDGKKGTPPGGTTTTPQTTLTR